MVALEHDAIERPLVVLRQVRLPLLARREERHAWSLPEGDIVAARDCRRRLVVSVLRHVHRNAFGSIDGEERREGLVKVVGAVVAQEQKRRIAQWQQPVVQRRWRRRWQLAALPRLNQPVARRECPREARRQHRLAAGVVQEGANAEDEDGCEEDARRGEAEQDRPLHLDVKRTRDDAPRALQQLLGTWSRMLATHGRCVGA